MILQYVSTCDTNLNIEEVHNEARLTVSDLHEADDAIQDLEIFCQSNKWSRFLADGQVFINTWGHGRLSVWTRPRNGDYRPIDIGTWEVKSILQSIKDRVNLDPAWAKDKMFPAFNGRMAYVRTREGTALQFDRRAELDWIARVDGPVATYG